MGLKRSSTGAKHPKEELGVSLLQTLKIRIDKAKMISTRAEEQKQEQDISAQVMNTAGKKPASPYF